MLQNLNETIFLVSRFSDDIYSYIVNQCYLDIKKTDKNIIEIEKIKLKRFPDLKFLFFVFFVYSKEIFRKEKIIFLNFKILILGNICYHTLLGVIKVTYHHLLTISHYLIIYI